MFVCCECCMLSGRGLCDELITRPEKTYRLWCVVACNLETSIMRRPWPALGRSTTKKAIFILLFFCAMNNNNNNNNNNKLKDRWKRYLLFNRHASLSKYLAIFNFLFPPTNSTGALCLRAQPLNRSQFCGSVQNVSLPVVMKACWGRWSYTRRPTQY
jgi:hypothetical protein